MRRAWFVGVILTLGCQGLERPNDLWMMQIDSANAIPDPNMRGSTLARIAESAAYGRDVVATRYALSQLGDGAQRDELIAHCAILISPNDRDGARLLVQDIGNADRRNETLAKLDASAKDQGKPSQPGTATPNPEKSSPGSPQAQAGDREVSR